MRLLLPRLLHLYDPWNALGISDTEMFRTTVDHSQACGFTPDVARQPGYHASRVRHFMDHPDTIQPICVDNEFLGTLSSAAVVVVTDGHHRLIAAAYLGWVMINAEYGGLVSIGEWLKGHRSGAHPD